MATVAVPATGHALRSRHVVRPPVVTVYRADRPYFDVRVRFDRALPTDDQGVFANFLLAQAGSDAPPTPFGRRERHCYAAVIGNDRDDPGLRDARPGSALTLRVAVHGQLTIVRAVTLRSNHGAAVSALGCGRR